MPVLTFCPLGFLFQNDLLIMGYCDFLLQEVTIDHLPHANLFNLYLMEWTPNNGEHHKPFFSAQQV